MINKIGIWIDHTKAVIVFAAADQVTAKTVESAVGPHARYSGRAKYPTPGGSQDGRGEKKYEARFRQELDRYYDEVIGLVAPVGQGDQAGRPEEILIFGPGEAKLELRERFGRNKALSERLLEVETADKLTEAQIVAHVKERFGFDPREGGPRFN